MDSQNATIEKIGERDGISHYTCNVCGITFGIGGKHKKPPACPYEPWHEDGTEIV